MFKVVCLGLYILNVFILLEGYVSYYLSLESRTTG